MIQEQEKQATGNPAVQKHTGGNKDYEGRIIRILSKDVDADAKVIVGLTKIKGISWSIANAICSVLKLDKMREIGSLSQEEIKNITDFAKAPKVPRFILNRRFDFETGKDSHLIGSDLSLKNEFDIKRLKKIKNYKGVRHGAGLPLRGQRTRSNFRANRKRGVGIKSKNKGKEGEK